jgi:hypothetical protein
MRSGKLFPGDIIVKVNDVNMLQQPLQLCQSVITGPPASAVKFTIQRYVGGTALPLQSVIITRDMPSSPASALKQQQQITGCPFVNAPASPAPSHVGTAGVTGLCIDRSIVVQRSVGGLQASTTEILFHSPLTHSLQAGDMVERIDGAVSAGMDMVAVRAKLSLPRFALRLWRPATNSVFELDMEVLQQQQVLQTAQGSYQHNHNRQQQQQQHSYGKQHQHWQQDDEGLM